MDYFARLLQANRQAPQEVRSASWSVGDPALAEFLGLSGRTAAGVSVTESSSLGLTAVYRAVSLIAGTVASLPMKSYRTLGDDSRERIKTWLDEPGGPDGLTPYEWKETLLVHLLLHGNAYALHIMNGAGSSHALQLLPPRAVSVKEDRKAPGGKTFTVQLSDGTQRDFLTTELTHFTGLSTDGLIGLSPIQVARNAIATGIAGDTAAASAFANGMLVGGVISAENVTEEQAKEIKRGLKAKMAGANNAGDIAVVNADLHFDRWCMTMEDAQFVQSRTHQVEEVARIFGVPKTLLNQDGASTWGSGIAELIRGFQKFTLAPWTARIEERLSRLVKPRFLEFDYAGLLQPNQAETTDNMVKEIEAGLMTVEEGRRLLNRPALVEREEGGAVDLQAALDKGLALQRLGAAHGLYNVVSAEEARAIVGVSGPAPASRPAQPRNPGSEVEPPVSGPEVRSELLGPDGKPVNEVVLHV